MVKTMNENLFASMANVSIIAGKLGKLSVGKPQSKWPIIFASPEDEVRNVISRMVELDLDEIPVLDRKEVLGIISLKTVVKRKNIPPSTKVRSLITKPPELHPWSNVFDLAHAIVNTGFRQIPVVEDGKLAGIADRTALVRLVSGVKELGGIRVDEVMSPGAITLHEKDYVDSAFETLRSTGIRALPVVDDFGRITSMLVITDLASLVVSGRSRETVGEIAGRANPVEITVGSIARKDFPSLSRDDRMDKVFRMMSSEDAGSVPVLENKMPVGIITKYDIAQLVTSLQIRESVYVQITGVSDSDILDTMYGEIGKSMKRIEKISRPVSLYIHVHEYGSEFSKVKYSLSGKLQTADRLFVAKSFQWDPTRTIQDLLSKLERMVKEMKSFKVSSKKRKKSARLALTDEL